MTDSENDKTEARADVGADADLLYTESREFPVSGLVSLRSGLTEHRFHEPHVKNGKTQGLVNGVKNDHTYETGNARTDVDLL